MLVVIGRMSTDWSQQRTGHSEVTLFCVFFSLPTGIRSSSEILMVLVLALRRVTILSLALCSERGTQLKYPMFNAVLPGVRE